MSTMHRMMMTMAGAAALALAMPATEASAAVGTHADRPTMAEARDPGARHRGVQLEGVIGGAGCIPGRAPCRYDDQRFRGYTAPSLGLGLTLGWRPTSWIMAGAMYRLGMFTPQYDGRGADYSIATQHTVSAFVRPILPIWRLDLGFNFAPGYARQTFHFKSNHDSDYSQGFSILLGPTIDFWLRPKFFMGAEIDFIFNAQRRVCSRRGDGESCVVNPTNQVAPTHQSLFGFHVGGTF